MTMRHRGLRDCEYITCLVEQSMDAANVLQAGQQRSKFCLLYASFLRSLTSSLRLVIRSSSVLLFFHRGAITAL